MSKLYKYNPEKDKPIFNSLGEQLTSIPTTRTKKIYNEDGSQLSKITLKIPQNKGFAKSENASKRNKNGRPKGSKSKNTLKDAIKRFQSNQLDAAQLIIAVMNGDEAYVGGEIKVAERVGAARYVIEAPSKMSNNSSKKEDSTILVDDDRKEPEEVVPLISLTVEDKV